MIQYIEREALDHDIAEMEAKHPQFAAAWDACAEENHWCCVVRHHLNDDWTLADDWQEYRSMRWLRGDED